jgi:hypothetical protein
MLSTPQRYAHGLTAAQLLQFDRLCRFIPQAVKDKSSAFITAFICSYLR